MRAPLAFNRLESSTSTWRLFADGVNQEEAPSEFNEEPAPSSSSSSDILNSPAFLKRKLEVLKSDIAKVEADTEETKALLEAGKAEWGPQLEALQQEYKNIQERMNSQSNQGDAMAIVQVSREILSVLDNYDRAFGAVKPSTESEAAIEAEYRATYDDLMKTLEKIGVEEVATVGTEFDYEVHQAVMQRASEDYTEGIVCEEFQKGFKLGNTLIRAAMVAVAA
ncbi:hypothetical protein ACA910_017193 [Epithemia clementina (nom. ined.)]